MTKGQLEAKISEAISKFENHCDCSFNAGRYIVKSYIDLDRFGLL